MIQRIFDLYAQGENLDVLLARIKHWLSTDVDFRGSNYVAHVKLVVEYKSFIETLRDAK